MSTSIDIIIPTYARPGAALRLAKSLRQFLSNEDRIFVVSQDKRQPAVDGDDRICHLNSAPPNLPKARNRGFAAGKGEIVLFLDDDVEALDEHLFDAHRRAHDDSRVGAVAGYIEDELFPARSDRCSVFDETTGEIDQNFSLTRPQETISVMGAHMSFKRKALEYIGGFDEHFKRNALWEDVDCAFRMRKAGWKIIFCPEAKVRHARTSAGGCRSLAPPRYIYHQFANTAYFAARFAEKRHYRSWMRFWKYRLEFLSRGEWLLLNHNPIIVAAAALGACGGIIRYLTRRDVHGMGRKGGFWDFRKDCTG